MVQGNRFFGLIPIIAIGILIQILLVFMESRSIPSKAGIKLIKMDTPLKKIKPGTDLKKDVSSKLATSQDHLKMIQQAKKDKEGPKDVVGHGDGVSSTKMDVSSKLTTTQDHLKMTQQAKKEKDDSNVIQNTKRYIAKRSDGISSIKKDVAGKLSPIQDHLKMAKQTIKELESKLVYLKIIAKSALGEKKRVGKLDKMSSKNMSDEFSKINVEFEKSLIALESSRNGYKEAELAFIAAKNQHIKFHNAMSEAKYAAHNMYTIKELYAFANISTKKVDKSLKLLQEASENLSDSLPQKNSASKTLEAYHHYMIGFSKKIEKNNKNKEEISKTFKILNEKKNAYMSDILETMLLLNIYNKYDLAIKSKENSKAKKPNVTTNTLNANVISGLQKEIITAFTHILPKYLAGGEYAVLSNKIDQPTFLNIKKFMAQIIDFISTKTNILQKYQMVKDEISQKNRDEADIKAKEQQALRRFSSESSLWEHFLSIMPSTRANDLTEVVKAFYEEIIILEDKKKKINALQSEIDRMIKLTGEEKQSTQKLVEFIKKNILSLEAEYKKLIVDIKLRLAPDKAKDTLKELKMDKAYVFHMPIKAIAKEDMQNAIVATAAELASLHVATISLKENISTITNKVSTGTQKELKNYNNDKESLLLELLNLNGRINFLNDELSIIRKEQNSAYMQGGMEFIIKFIILLIVAFFLNRLSNNFIRSLEQRSADNITLYSLINIVSKVFIWSLTVITALYFMGVNITAFLAGLGIGGFALAMSLQGAMTDIFGGITVIMSKAFKVGDIIDYKGRWGVVKEIGLRYTTLEDFSYNHIIRVPNSMLTEVELVNVSAHPGFTILTNVRLSTENSADKIRFAVELVEKTINEHPGARFIWVKHDHFDDFSFVLRIHYDINKFKERAKVETDINSGIVEEFKNHNIIFTPLPVLPPTTV